MAPKTLMLLALAAATAACGEIPLGGPAKPFEPSAAAVAALPEGVDPGFLIRDANGCYGIVIEVAPEGEPASGPALLDANGVQVCDGAAGGVGVTFAGTPT